MDIYTLPGHTGFLHVFFSVVDPLQLFPKGARGSWTQILLLSRSPIPQVTEHELNLVQSDQYASTETTKHHQLFTK